MQGIAFTIDKPVRNYMVLHGFLFLPSFARAGADNKKWAPKRMCSLPDECRWVTEEVYVPFSRSTT